MPQLAIKTGGNQILICLRNTFLIVIVSYCKLITIHQKFENDLFMGAISSAVV